MTRRPVRPRSPASPPHAGLRTGRRTRRRHGIRSTFGATPLLVRRRAVRDLALLVLSWTLLAGTALLALQAPALADRTLDAGAREAVRSLGTDADLVLASTVSAAPFGPGQADVTTWLQDTDAVTRALPAEIAAVTGDAVRMLVGFSVPVDAVTRGESTVTRTTAEGDLTGMTPGAVSLTLLDEDAAAGVRPVSGALPTVGGPQDDAPHEVAVPQGDAVAADLEVGDVLTLPPVLGGTAPGMPTPPVRVVVTALVEPVDPDATLWRDQPQLWVTPEAARAVPLLAPPDTVATLAPLLGVDSGARLRLPVVADAFDSARAAAFARTLDRLQGDPTVLAFSATSFEVRRSTLDETLAAYLDQSLAARAQMSVAMTGVSAVAAVVLLLTARLLVVRRAGAVALERARGASTTSVVVRASVESTVLTVLAVGAAVLLTTVPGAGDVRLDAATLAPVLLVGLLAGPVETWRASRRLWSATRVPANPRDRRRLARRTRARTMVLTAGLLVVAAASVVSLRQRGLAPQTAGADPFLAAAPVLLAVAVTVVAMWVHPWLVRGAARLARRSRGVLGLVGAARAGRALAPVPLLALTLGAAVAVSGSLLLETVRTGQVDASWQRVGADARVDLARFTGARGAELPAELAAAPGVTAFGTAGVSPAAPLDLGARDLEVSVLAVDEGYVGSIDRLPDAGTDRTSLDRLVGEPRDASGGEAEPAAGDRLPVVVDTALAAALDASGATELSVTFRGSVVPIEVVGTTDHAPVGQLPGPFLFMDRDAVEPYLGDELSPDLAWLHGPGAAAAVSDLPDGTALVREEWLAARTGPGLAGGIADAMQAALAATALLAGIALVVTVVSGARDRGTTLALLRTLGLRARLGWWVALAELAPVVLAAVVAGSVAGVLVVLTLGPALGLDTMTGGVGMPALSIAPGAVVSLVATAVVLLVLAVVVEVLTHRRQGLHQVLRVGGDG